MSTGKWSDSSQRIVPYMQPFWILWFFLLFIPLLYCFLCYSSLYLDQKASDVRGIEEFRLNAANLERTFVVRREKRNALFKDDFTPEFSLTNRRRRHHKVYVRRNESAKMEEPRKKLPSVIIIGVKKGGTRALLTFLRLHPDIRAVGPETHFFDKYYHNGLEWYRNLMPPTVDGQLTMEKTPSYFVTKEVPKRIYQMSPEMKLLVVVRDPVTRAVSDYAQTVSKRSKVTTKPFDNLAFYNHTTGLVDTSWSAIKIGLYSKHLTRWLQYFPMRQIHFVSGENLIKRPAQEMFKVQKFLKLQPIISDRHFYFNQTKGFPCLKKSRSGGRPRCLGKTKGRVHPNIREDVLQRLRNFYKPFNLKFYKMTGIDFGWNS